MSGEPELLLNCVLFVVVFIWVAASIFLTFYRLSTYTPQTGTVLGFKKRHARKDKIFGTTLYHYVVAYKDSRGKLAEGLVNIRSPYLMDIERVRIYTRGNIVKFIDISSLGLSLCWLAVGIGLFFLILYIDKAMNYFLPVVLCLFIVGLTFEYWNRRQISFRDPSFILKRIVANYKRRHDLLKTKLTKGERADLNMSGRLLSYEEAVRLEHSNQNPVTIIIGLLLGAAFILYTRSFS